MKAEELKYNGSGLEDLVSWVLSSEFTYGQREFGYPTEELRARKLAMQINGEMIHDLLKHGVEDKKITSYALYAVIQMMKRGILPDQTVEDVRWFFVGRYVGEYKNVNLFAEVMAAHMAHENGREALSTFNVMKEYMDWREYAEDNYRDLFWMVSINENSEVPDGPIYVFRK